MNAEHSSEEGGEGLTGVLAVVRDDRDRYRARVKELLAERDVLRGRLAAVEALVEGDLGTHYEEGRDGEPGSWVRGARHVRVALRAALANPSAEADQ